MKFIDRTLHFNSILLCFLALSLLHLSSCGIIQPISKKSETSRSEITTVFERARIHIEAKKFQQAQDVLSSLRDQELREIELAEKYNYLGLIAYSQNKQTRAREHFLKALSRNFSSDSVKSQIHLNLAMTEYKMHRHQQALSALKDIIMKSLNSDDLLKANQLKYVLAKKENDTLMQTEALLGLISPNIQSETALLNDKFFRNLSRNFSAFDYDEQVRFISQNDFYQSFALNYLIERTIIFYEGLGQDLKASELRSMLKSLSGQSTSITKERETVEKIDVKKIGIVLPLSGDKKEFAEKVLAGLTLALKDPAREHFTLVIKDSRDSAAVASLMVEMLVREESVALVIGGLFPSTAQVEYQEARRLGAAYISLAPVYSYERNKDHLLIEMPGSIESQMSALISSGFMKQFGNRYALLYPEDQQGKAYADSFWRVGALSQAEMSAISSYQVDVTDYRDAVKSMVGLAYPKERSVEYELWQEILNLKLRSKADRALPLRPEIHFDWVFLPTTPKTLHQLISTFEYFGVKKMIFVGGPSWRSRSLHGPLYQRKKLFFVDALNDEKSSQLNLYFSQHYDRPVKLLESLGFDSMILATQVLRSYRGTKRSALGSWLSEQDKLHSFMGIWIKQGSLWVKSMDVYKVTDNDFIKFEM